MHGGSRGTDGQMKPTSTKQVFDMVGLDKSDIFLDVGHGRGSVFYLLHLWGIAPKQMLGIDFDPVKAYDSTTVRAAQEIYFKERGHPMAISPSRLRLMCGDIMDLESIEPATVVYAGERGKQLSFPDSILTSPNLEPPFEAWEGWPPNSKKALMSLFENCVGECHGTKTGGRRCYC